jgi:hypothetical protein
VEQALDDLLKKEGDKKGEDGEGQLGNRLLYEMLVRRQ